MGGGGGVQLGCTPPLSLLLLLPPLGTGVDVKVGAGELVGVTVFVGEAGMLVAVFVVVFAGISVANSLGTVFGAQACNENSVSNRKSGMMIFCFMVLTLFYGV